MNLRFTIFVYDEDGDLKGRHTFYADDEKTLYAISHGLVFAMSRYCKDYKVISTPIHLNTFELDKEEESL